MGLFVDLGCTVLYVQYVIHVSDAGIRTWYAATVTRCTELLLSYAHPSVNVGLDFYVSAGGGEMLG